MSKKKYRYILLGRFSLQEKFIENRPCALLNKNNDNALSLLFKMGNEYCNIINNARKNNALSLTMHYF